MRRNEARKCWTPEEHARLMAMVAAARKWPDIAAALGRSEAACATRYHMYKGGGGFRRSQRAIEVVAAAARQANASIEHKSITAAIFGDPLPGRSALDRRQAEAGIRSISLAGGAR